jgi:hypothetical protein
MLSSAGLGGRSRWSERSRVRRPARRHRRAEDRSDDHHVMPPDINKPFDLMHADESIRSVIA